jgi:lysosomal acid lipase/cholesteryl ester hydrolase
MISLIIIITTIQLIPHHHTRDLTIDQINTFGYDGEAHDVQTHDGYILTLHRFKPRNVTDPTRVCLIIHGICSSSSEFLLTKRTSLALYLFENGFDVFLGNVRGSRYSLAHSTFHPDGGDFWNFTLHEMATFDLPAMIDFALGLTGTKKLFYIGHSQGATIPLMLLASRPEYNGKIRQLHLSAPAAFMGNFPNPLVKRFGRQTIKRFARNNLINLSPLFDFLQENLNRHCTLQRPLYFVVCMLIEFLLLGDNFERLEADHEVFPEFLKFFSPNVSSLQALHFLQFIESGKFRHFDYGSDENVVRYGSEKAPEYALEKVVVPTYVYCAERDGIVNKKVSEIFELFLNGFLRF